MKCIVKRLIAILLTAVLTAGIIGCGSEIPLDEKYDIYQTTERYGIRIASQSGFSSLGFFAEDLAVGGNTDITDESVTEDLSLAAGLFQLQDQDILYAKSIHERLHPASTTKILTAYVALKYGDLSSVATVSETALDLEPGAVTCGLSAGDQITLEELMYGLLLCSGNDAANVIAELISGSIEDFANLMNQEARALGATNTHFVNPNGLTDEQHYTTVYDLYLMFQAALQDERFYHMITTEEHTGTFQNSQGETVTKEWTTTNQYLNGNQELPEGVTVVGGKTGTTKAAGNCLVLYSENQSGVPYISIVMKADDRDHLYYQMTELLKKTWN